MAWWYHLVSRILVNITSGTSNGSLPPGNEPLPEVMLTNHEWGLVAFTWGQFHRKCSESIFEIWYHMNLKMSNFNITAASPRGQRVKDTLTSMPYAWTIPVSASSYTGISCTGRAHCSPPLPSSAEPAAADRRQYRANSSPLFTFHVAPSNILKLKKKWKWTTNNSTPCNAG